jgi:hypothetical protein
MRRVVLIVSLCLAPMFTTSADPVATYLDAWRKTFPSRATAAGDYRFDDRLESLDEARRIRWIELNRETLARVEAELASAPGDARRLDLELLSRQVRQELMEWQDEDQARTDPLFWAGVLAQANLHLFLREDRPAAVRMGFVLERTRQIPALVDTALGALAQADPAAVIPERAAEAAGRLEALASFYRDRLATGAGDDAERAADLAQAGAAAAEAIGRLGQRAAELGKSGRADFRLGERYHQRFAVVTGLSTPVPEVLAQAYADLAAKREEAAAFGRGLWPQWLADEPAPVDDVAVLRRLFAVVEARRPSSTAELVAQFNADADAAFAFVRERELMTLPEPRTLVVDVAPAWLGGQSVGGVYPAGPWSPEAETLFLLPNVPDDAPQAVKDRFYAAFNEGFNRMISPHELVPGHYVQAKIAARLPHPVRSLFGDGVYVEGWGSFAERLFLDLGWGGPHERLAHYKKQLENIARLIADIEVHTGGWDEARLGRFLAEEAVLDAQFAANLWKRAMLTSPQLTTYHLGYRDIHAIWLEWRRRHPERQIREFVDGMTVLGAVPVAEYRRALLPR